MVQSKKRFRKMVKRLKNSPRLSIILEEEVMTPAWKPDLIDDVRVEELECEAPGDGSDNMNDQNKRSTKNR